MTAHTPGPWQWYFRNGDANRVSGLGTNAADGSWQRIATVTMEEGQEREGNARLIAAAPDLLDALEAAVQDVEFAARLTRFDSQRGLHEDASDKLADELDSHIAIYRAAIAKAKGVTP